MSDPVSDRFAHAAAVAGAAAEMALAHFRHREELVVEAKANAQDVVSRADREVETLIRDAVARAFPEDGFLGEEFGATLGTTGFTWIVDPIDGTTPFLAGLPHWCVSIAVRRGGTTEIGAIAAPTRDALYLARRGAGATLNGVALRDTGSLTLRNGLAGIGASHRVAPEVVAAAIGRLLAAGGMFYRDGSGALMLAEVAAGRLAAYWEPHMYPWDALAGLLLVAEAGGRTALYRPDRSVGRGDRVLAASEAAWREALEIFG
jgi:myo-inositol-1(or 4)-monophosphatase